MKLRWRQHECILVSGMGILLLCSWCWRFAQAAPGQLRMLYELPFTDHNTSFNLYRNVVFPELLPALLVYLAWLFFYLYGIPKLLNKKKWGWLLLQLLMVTIIFSAAFMIAFYYREQWRYNYPGFSFFPVRGVSIHEQLDVRGVYLAVLSGCLLYGVYVLIREGIIRLIERRDGSEVYRALIVNRVTLFVVIYALIAFAAAVFHLVHDSYVIAFYYTFIIPAFALYLSNTYWLFPAKGSHAFNSQYFLTRLLLSSFLCSLLSLFSPFNQAPVLLVLGFWVFLLGVITPLNWLLFQQQKDKIVQLRGAQKAVAKSSADLQFLRSQINPHFLFNTLNTLYGTALEENSDRTAAGIQRLGDMMRFMLYENNLDFIDMKREMDYLNNYIALQKLRVAESPDILIETSIDDSSCHHRIAPMLLIPFVENAFKHGIHMDRKSWIHCKLACTGKEIHFTISNSMHPAETINPETEHGGIGNQNVKDRLKLIYPARHQLTITANGDVYMVNLIILP